jgi:hypothetical protein
MWSAKHHGPTHRRNRCGSARRTGKAPTVAWRPLVTSIPGPGVAPPADGAVSRVETGPLTASFLLACLSYDAAVVTWDDGPGVVELPDGRRIRGRGLRHPQPEGPRPQLGVYLLGRDPGPFEWEHRWVRWPDFRTPASSDAAVAALRQAFERSVEERVEIACGGGVGRTGTALAAVAVLGGVPSGDAVAWVRARYHPRAVETPWQRRWVRRIAYVALNVQE